MSHLSARLRRPLETVIREGHPWVYRDALERFDAPPGATLQIHDRRGRFLATGLAEAGPIGARIFSLQRELIGPRLYRSRLSRAIESRALFIKDDTTAYRLLHGEGDRLPGFVVDRYADHLVLRPDGAAASARAEELGEILSDAAGELGVKTILLREGRGERLRVRPLYGEAPTGPVLVEEHGMKLWANLLRGQKTGLFLDHRESRRRVRAISRNLRVLNLYSYNGGFSVAAALGGAQRITSVDIAAEALEDAALNFELNGLPNDTHRRVPADVARFLAEDDEGPFDLVIADPPSFAPNERAVEPALRNYRALHHGSLSRVITGGYYLAASCSSHITQAAFEETVREAARELGIVLQLVDRWGAPEDHPRLAAFPEGDYLSCALYRRL